MKLLIKEGTVFAQLDDIDVFKSKLTVLNDTVAWDIEGNKDTYKCIDIDPETIFKGAAITDPLQWRNLNLL